MKHVTILCLIILLLVGCSAEKPLKDEPLIIPEDNAPNF